MLRGRVVRGVIQGGRTAWVREDIKERSNRWAEVLVLDGDPPAGAAVGSLVEFNRPPPRLEPDSSIPCGRTNSGSPARHESRVSPICPSAAWPPPLTHTTETGIHTYMASGISTGCRKQGACAAVALLRQGTGDRSGVTPPTLNVSCGKTRVGSWYRKERERVQQAAAKRQDGPRTW